MQSLQNKIYQWMNSSLIFPILKIKVYLKFATNLIGNISHYLNTCYHFIVTDRATDKAPLLSISSITLISSRNASSLIQSVTRRGDSYEYAGSPFFIHTPSTR